jgi:hypothetical protein
VSTSTRNVALLILALAGCSIPEPSLDEEAGSTTSPGESESDDEGDDGGSTSTSTSASTSAATSASTSASTSTSTEEDSEETDTGTDGHVFIAPSDLGGCECDPFAQDCPEGEKCVAYASSGGTWDANKCVEVVGDGAPGEACSSDGLLEASDSCDAGSACWNVIETDDQLLGTCKAFCGGTGDNPVCAEGHSCVIANEGSITLCIETCDPVLQDCGEGLGCVWAQNDFNCIFINGAELGVGEPCTSASDCASLSCVDAGFLPGCAGASCCTESCHVDAPACSLPGTECVPQFEPGSPHENIGVCILPG